MIYSSPQFAALLVITLTAFFIFSSPRLRAGLLLAASVFFIAWSGWSDLLVFLGTMLFTWLCSRVISENSKRGKLWLAFGILGLVAQLFYWKYFSWLAGEAHKAYPNWFTKITLGAVLPLGISFYTLQSIAYLTDLYRGHTPFAPFRRFFLFLAFFPQLIAGPIVRGRQLLPQLERFEWPKSEGLAAGLSLFCMGFFKKVAVADRLASVVDPVFKFPEVYDPLSLSLSLVGYSVQIWADFSGYTDMGIGVARMFGVRLPENFASPYFSKSPGEFWRRWHITLSSWIKDYIYIPLGGRSGGAIRSAAVLLVTFTISGLWHGANWTFIVWGVYHGMLLLLERIIRASDKFRFIKRVPPMLSVLFTYLAVLFGWLIFRAESLDGVRLYLNHIVSGSGDGVMMGMNTVLLSVAFAFTHHVFFYRERETRMGVLARFEGWLNRVATQGGGAAMVLGLSVGIVVALIYLGVVVLAREVFHRPFIYFQF